MHPLGTGVLVVDDHDQWRRYVVFTLGIKREIQIVGEAADGMTAIRKAKEHQPDLVILDVGLPDLSGIDVARQISLLSPNTKIVFLTMHYSQDVIAAALSAGAYGYVLKSQAGRDLLPAIEAALAGNHFISQRAG